MKVAILFVLQLIVLVAYLIAICVPRGFWQRNRTAQQSQKKKEIHDQIDAAMFEQQAIEKEVIRQCLKTTKWEEAENITWLRDRLYRGIEYAAKRHDWYEDQRSRIFQVLLATITIVVTYVGFVLRDYKGELIGTGMLPVLLAILAALIAAIYHYHTELGPNRPYRAVSDVRLWYFHYNFPEHSDRLEDKPAPIQIAENVLKERQRFFKRMEQSIDPLSALREDFEQLFILQVLQRYRKESLTSLKWLLIYTLITFVLLVCLSFVYSPSPAS